MRVNLLIVSLGLVFACTRPARAAFVERVLSDNPTGFWILNDVGPAAVDSVNAFNGTYGSGVTPQGTDGPSWVPTPGFVADFTGGIDGSITFPRALNLGANGYTIEVWIKPTNDDLTQTSRFVASGDGFNGYAFGTTDGADLVFTSFAVQDYVTTVRLLPNVWQYVGVVLDASNNALFYLNGSFVERVAAESDNTGGTLPTIGNFTIGSRTPGVGLDNEPFGGGLAGISVYDRSLTPGEIQAQFEAAIPEPPSLLLSGLVAFGAGCILRQRHRKASSSIPS